MAGGGAEQPYLRSYDKENRSWLARLYESETDTVTTVANVEIRDPELKVAVPLFSISHASGRDLGNTWVTNYTQSFVESPLFLIGPNSAIIVHLTANASRDLKSDAAASIIGAVTQAVQIAAPTSTLLTTLSKPQISNAASAIDTTISNLFSSDKTENVELGRFGDTWMPGSRLVLTGCAPFVQTDDSSLHDAEMCSIHQDDSSMDIRVGRWTIALRCPQISIFDPLDICDGNQVASDSVISQRKTEIAGKADSASILNFPLSNQITISKFIQTQSWYTNFINSSKQTNDVTNFCAAALSGTASLSESGLSNFDSALALNAAVHSMTGLAPYESKFGNHRCDSALGQSKQYVSL